MVKASAGRTESIDRGAHVKRHSRRFAHVSAQSIATNQNSIHVLCTTQLLEHLSKLRCSFLPAR
jgi:hypothetical protein